MPLPTTEPLGPLDRLYNPGISWSAEQLGAECRRLALKLHGLKRRTEASHEIMLALAAAGHRLAPKLYRHIAGATDEQALARVARELEQLELTKPTR